MILGRADDSIVESALWFSLREDDFASLGSSEFPGFWRRGQALCRIEALALRGSLHGLLEVRLAGFTERFARPERGAFELRAGEGALEQGARERSRCRVDLGGFGRDHEDAACGGVCLAQQGEGLGAVFIDEEEGRGAGRGVRAEDTGRILDVEHLEANTSQREYIETRELLVLLDEERKAPGLSC